ncbi:MAG: C1 family peptidase [Acidovorax sp.]
MTEQLPADDLVADSAPFSTGVVDEPEWLPERSTLESMTRWLRSFVTRAFEATPQQAFSWDDQQVVPQPGDQQKTNACVSYASCLAAASLYRIKTGKPISLAPRVFHACTVGRGLKEGFNSSLLERKVVEHGLPTTVNPEQTSRAEALTGEAQCGSFASTPRLKVSSVQRLYSPEEAKAALRSIGPVVVHMDLTEDFLDCYVAGSIYSAPPGTKILTSHAVCVIGYDDTRGCWICVNSYGPTWRHTNRGRFFLKYGECRVLAPGAAAYRLNIEV